MEVVTPCLQGEYNANWREHIVASLQQRNLLQRTFFQELITRQNGLLAREKVLNHKTNSLERELLRLRQENAELQHKTQHEASSPIAIPGGSPSPPSRGSSSSSLSSSFMGDLDAFKLQQELTESYKRNSENATELLNLNKQLKETTELLKASKRDVEKWKAEHANEQALTAKLREELQDKEAVIQVLKDELESLRSELRKHQAKLAELEAENQDLLERWLKKAQEEAHKVNTANDFYQEMLLAMQQNKLLQDAQAKMPEGGLADLASNSGGNATVTVPKKAKLKIGHKAEVNSVAFNSTGSSLVTGSTDKTVRVWDSEKGGLRATLSGAVQSVMSVGFSPDDSLVVGASNDNATRVWSMEYGRVRHTLTGHIGKVFSATFSGDGQKVVTGSHDRTIKIWDLNKGYCSRTIFCYSSCNDLDLSSDGNLICSGHMDKKIRFWDSRSGDCAHELRESHAKQVTGVCFSPGSTSVLTVSRDNTLKLVDARTYQVVNSYRAEHFHVGSNWTRGCFSPDGSFVAAGSAQGAVYVWNTESAALEITLEGEHSGVVHCVAWSPSGEALASVSADRTLVLWA